MIPRLLFPQSGIRCSQNNTKAFAIAEKGYSVRKVAHILHFSIPLAPPLSIHRLIPPLRITSINPVQRW